jgi:UDP-N-acetylmuramoyl-tripeptide--D-alanyl-D-alanine ligase
MPTINTEQLYSIFKTCSGVSTDTRSIVPGSMFFALKGPNFNANLLASQAISLGAKYAVVDDAQYATSPETLLVTDGLAALQALAKQHRNHWSIPVIGLTGSNGKTTSKELLQTVLSQKYNTYATKGNLNNHIGVPLTILNCPTKTEIAIIEMGANHQHEIALLCSIAQPTHGFITNIGKAHLEGFGGIEGIKKGKGELFDYLTTHQGTAFVNAQNETLLAMAGERNFKEKIIYQQANSPEELKLTQHNPLVQFTDSEGNTIKTQLTGKYNFENIVNAIAIGRYFGLTALQANTGIAIYNPNNNRSQWLQQGSNKILLDAYNANPSSMAAAIQNFAEMQGNKKMVILGDMFELGDQGPSEHEALGKTLSTCKIDTILLVGSLMQNALKHLPTAYYFTDKHSLHLWLHDHKTTECQILIKGSRGMGLESVLPFLQA